MPLVSILLLSYNQAEFLDAALQSALAQTWRRLEVVVVDNGSTDGTPAILERFADDPRVTVRRHPENGPITARMNEAVQTARGEWVSFLFSDDYYLPTKVEQQVHAALADPTAGVVYAPVIFEEVRTGTRTVSPSLAASGWVFEDLMTRHFAGPIEMVTALVRRQALVEHPFHEDLFTEGESMFFRLALYERFLFVDEPLAVMRQHEWNMGKAFVRNRHWILRMHEKLRDEPGLTSAQRPLVDAHDAQVLRSCAWQGARLGVDPAWVRNCLRLAAARQLASLAHPHALGAAALSLSPAPLVRLANRLGDRAAPNRERVLVADYDGITRGG